MPQLLEHIDRIARLQGRAVLFVSFEVDSQSTIGAPNHQNHDYDQDTNRMELCAWLDQNGIDWKPCGHFASETSWVAHNGNICVDVPWDEYNPGYIKLRDKLENPDGTPKNPDVKFWLVTLEEAMKNAHHDEPGFVPGWIG